MDFSARPSNRPIGGGGSSPRRIFWACSSIVVMSFSSGKSVRPCRFAFNSLTVAGATLDHAVGPVLDAQEIERRTAVVAPGPCPFWGDAQDRAFLNVDALAIYQKLTSTRSEERRV